jgi:hypothetical protein
MRRPWCEKRSGSSGGRRRTPGRTLLAGCLFLVACAAGNTATVQPDTVRSHIYPLPLDNVLAQSATLMEKKGWAVKRGGDVLLTNWQGAATGTLVSYRILGQRIDAGLCTLRVERLVATRSTSFGTDHPVTELDRGLGMVESRPFRSDYEAEPASDSAGTAPPQGMFSSTDTARASPWVVSHHQRDAELELELQREIDPTPLAIAEPEEKPGVPRATVAPVDAASPVPVAVHEAPTTPSPERQPADLAGIWDGTFTFRGTVMGSFAGEVTIAVDGRAVEVDDFCPEHGGMLTATGANNSAAWQGNLVCPAIPVKDCPAATFTYSFAHATVQDSTLTLIAAGSVETDHRCIASSGELSVAFVGQKADYVHIAVSRAKKATSCLWPSDWEDFTSAGSMSMPEPPQEESAYLGIIRAKGSRLSEIQKLLRHCHQVVLLHGEPVLMKLAASRPHRESR